MQSLGYRPNGAARALKSGRFHTVGVIMTSLQTFGNIRTLDAIAQEAAQTDYSVTLLPISDPTLGRVSGAYQRLSAQAVDGAVILLRGAPARSGRVRAAAGNPGRPDRLRGRPRLHGGRHRPGARRPAGHRAPAASSATARSGTSPGLQTAFSAARRAESWARTLREAGITPPPVLRGDWTSESGYRHGLTLGRRADVTAIFAANDQMALGVMRALHELGRDIPGDISIVGFDDMAEARSFWPPLTTIRQDFAAVGRLSIRKLLEKVSGAVAENDKTSVPTELIVRNSTAAPSG